MPYKRLYIWIEGDDDERFFDGIIKPKLQSKYDYVGFWQYAQVKEEKNNNFLNSIKAMGADYIFVADINSAQCVTVKKQKVDIKNIDRDRIIILIKEIESWYLAGLDSKNAKKFRIAPHRIRTTDNVIKEQFDNLIPEKFDDSRIDFMSEILKHFCIETAKVKNKSFNYFVRKYLQL